MGKELRTASRAINKALMPVLKKLKLPIPVRFAVRILIKKSLKQIDMFSGSWKTSLGGILAAVGLSLTAMADPTLKLIGTIVAALGAFLTGQSARDNKKTSEEVGAK